MRHSPIRTEIGHHGLPHDAPYPPDHRRCIQWIVRQDTGPQQDRRLQHAEDDERKESRTDVDHRRTQSLLRWQHQGTCSFSLQKMWQSVRLDGRESSSTEEPENHRGTYRGRDAALLQGHLRYVCSKRVGGEKLIVEK